MTLKNIYIYDATPEDRIQFCGREIKAKGKAVPQKPITMNGIRLQFYTDFSQAAAYGLDQRLDIAVVNMPQHRGTSLNIQYLGVAGIFPLEIAEVN